MDRKGTPFVDLHFTTNVVNPIAVAWRARSPLSRHRHLWPQLDGEPVDPRRGESVQLLFDASRRLILHNLGQLVAAAPRAVVARPGTRRGHGSPPR